MLPSCSWSRAHANSAQVMRQSSVATPIMSSLSLSLSHAQTCLPACAWPWLWQPIQRSHPPFATICEKIQTILPHRSSMIPNFSVGRGIRTAVLPACCLCGKVRSVPHRRNGVLQLQPRYVALRTYFTSPAHSLNDTQTRLTSHPPPPNCFSFLLIAAGGRQRGARRPLGSGRRGA